MEGYEIRIFANACITRYKSGERSMNTIITSYGLVDDNASLVRNEIIKKLPSVDFDVE